MIEPGLWLPAKPALVLPGRRRPLCRRAQPLRVTNLVGFGAGSRGAQVAGPPSDPDFASVVMLASFDGADGATAFSDESPAAHGAFTFGSTAQLDTAQKKFGTASLLLAGDDDDLASLPDDADWAVGSGDFTAEGQARWDVLPTISTGYIISHFAIADGQRGWAIGLSTAGALRFLYTTDGTVGTQVVEDSGVDDGFVADTQHHLAACRIGNDLFLFLDGILKHTADVTGVTIFDPTSATPLTLGSLDGQLPMGEGSPSWHDEWRITKTVGRYPANFTPPAVAFPRQ